MKKYFFLFMGIVCICIFSSCTNSDNLDSSTAQKNESSQILNPLKDKEYETLQIDAETDFSTVLSQKLFEYSGLMTEWKDYVQEHSNDFENGKKLCDMDDFSNAFDNFYKWCYQITNYNSQQVPEEYRPIWKKLQGIAAYTKAMMDRMYTEDAETMAQSLDTMADQVNHDLEALSELMPKPKVSVGDTITEDGFAEIKLKKISYQSRINPSDTSGFYTYYEVKNKDNIYLACQFDFTNLQEDAGYDLGDYLSFSVTYDGGYTYTGWSIAEDSGSLTTYPNLLPLTTFDAYYLIEVPKKLQGTDYTLTCTVNNTSYTID